jgi:hypothetical protein
MSATALNRSTFDHLRVDISDRPVERNLPQRIGRAAWAPMLVMAVMAWPAALALGLLRSDAVATGRTLDAAALGQLVPAVTFFGFMAVFSSIAFAIARVLGEFRVGGGQVQQALAVPVHSLAMPLTAKMFIATMAMGMMMLVGAVVAHSVLAVRIWSGDIVDASELESWSVDLEAIRRLGTTVYLVSLLLGLSTVVQVVRFQTDRLRAILATRH